MRSKKQKILSNIFGDKFSGQLKDFLLCPQGKKKASEMELMNQLTDSNNLQKKCPKTKLFQIFNFFKIIL